MSFGVSAKGNLSGRPVCGVYHSTVIGRSCVNQTNSMNDHSEPLPPPDELPVPASDSALPPDRTPLFDRTDWLSFGVTSLVSLGIYLFTIAPNVTLDFSGMLATGANYAGVPNPPGFPLWTLYAWLFTKLLPFSNIAWRIAASSAVAAGLTCGLLALMTSRGSVLIAEGLNAFRRLESKAEHWLRVICGFVAGMAFGLSTPFWHFAVIVEAKTLGCLMLMLTLCFLMVWTFAPGRKRYLYAAALTYGLLLTCSQSFLVVALGLAFLILAVDLPMGRDVLIASTLVLTAGLIANGLDLFQPLPGYLVGRSAQFGIYCSITVIVALAATVVVFKTKALLTEWKSLLVSGFCFALGLSLSLYLPVASMTNPPSNWGYPRTEEGFYHVITRGQYERPNPVREMDRFVMQIGLYAKGVLSNVGVIYVPPALIPFWFLRRMAKRERSWMFGLMATFLCFSLLLMALINPNPDRASLELTSIFFSPSYLIVALWAGLGLFLVGTIISKQREPARVRETSSPVPP